MPQKDKAMKYIKFFNELNNRDVPLVGGKNASLGEMYQELVPKGIKVPNGFAITSDAYWYLLESGGIKQNIEGLLKGVDVHDLDVLKNISDVIRKLIFTTPIPKDLKKEILEAYKILSGEYGLKRADVAVRSSATAEDLPDASFAGQQDTYLNVKGESELIHYIKKCLASLFTDRAISYRASRGFDHFQVALSVGVQKMIRSDLGASGVMFSIDTESGFKDVVLITSSWGLGENIVGGTVIPDEFYVFKPTMDKANPILKRKLGKKDIKMVYSAAGSKSPTHNIPTTAEEQQHFSITDEDVVELAKYAMEIEKHYTKEAGVYRPMDMEWAKDGQSGEIYIVQARPETVQSQKVHKEQILETYTLKAKKSQKELLVEGTAVGGKIGIGKVRIINSLERINELKEGEVLVTDNTDPDWEPAMKKAAAVVTNRGGRTCHAAIVAREIGVPTIVGSHDATQRLQDGIDVTVSCAEGEDGYVYRGVLDFTVEQTDLSTLKKSKTNIYMNIANPEKAFSFAQIPNDGVGLARMEFIINNYIKAHPLALVDMHEGKEDVADAKLIKEIASGYKDPKEFFINRVAEGVGMIAAAFYPNPVVVRTSDFKSNEYKKMVGGAPYEPEEENPMLGFRGASRYYSDSYRPAFDWECEALKKVRDEMGLTNVKLMLPFVRTPQEGKKVLKIMAKNGLVQGKNDLEVYVMCELPSNVLLAKEFLKVFDGFSIGSNDLTQLTLGVDRDSELVSFIFDERNMAVKKMLKQAITACKKADKYVGICGQAPSDYPEITQFLVKQGIDSISLNPDSILTMRHTVLEIEEELKQKNKK
jgi:pyruvate,water dikinase